MKQPSTWAWWHLEDHPPRAAGETEAEYLTRHDLWLPGECQRFAKAGLAVGHRRRSGGTQAVRSVKMTHALPRRSY
jgi:hypothetical protein